MEIESSSVDMKKGGHLKSFQWFISKLGCVRKPGVGGCPLVIEPAEEWKPSQVPTIIVSYNTVSVNTVSVLFSTYPGDRWINYQINLQPCNGRSTPAALSQIVNTNGSTGIYVYVFKDVPPGCYSARVTLYQKPTGGIVDGRPVRSAPFNVTRVTVGPTEEPTTSPDAEDNNVIRISSQKPGGLATPADVEDKPKTLLLEGLIGAGVGVAVAILLLLTFVVKRQRSQGQSEIVSPQETPRAGLVNNMVQNDLTGPGYCDTYGHGDSVSVFRSECSQCCDYAGYPDNPEDFKSVTNMSGVTV
ncbi:uncharacterized protein LOC117307333 [Asterias rubens]|uniref:uncharacterized protein LOC117307333 n=1 Tax=Asterias rubens TaxID=7604 RepID=UPI001455B3C9|nr:uncharacterized protein LOC117307333 [Asterias rubens]